MLQVAVISKHRITSMEIFLQIIGSFVLVIVVLIMLAYLYIRLKFGKYIDIEPAKTQPPLIIHLNEDHSPD